MAGTEKARLADRRRQLLESAHGRLLEIGGGTGANLLGRPRRFHSRTRPSTMWSRPTAEDEGGSVRLGGPEHELIRLSRHTQQPSPTVQTPPCGETDLALRGISDLDVVPVEVH